MIKKKVLIVGSGAKEYALAKKMSERCDVYITSLSDTIKDFATSVDIREDKVMELLEFAMENGINLTIATSSLAVKSDIATKFAQNQQQIFAPLSNAGAIAYDKVLAKKLLYKLRIQTPKFGVFEKTNMALDYIKNCKKPFVIKNNDTNSATIFTSVTNAKNVLETMSIEKDNRIIIEDYIYGSPFSFYAITDGYKALPIGSSLTYKHSLEGNGGQLTSGKGACIPNYQISVEQEYFLMDNIIYPTLEYLELEGTPYLGILGINGIISDDGNIYILGWQSFMQDCDVAAILENIDEDLYSLMEACIIGSFSDEFDFVRLKDDVYTTLVLSNKNHQNKENVISGIPNLDEETIITYYPSVSQNKYLEYEAQNGPVLAITTHSKTFARAVKKSYEEALEIEFAGISYRKDIGALYKE